MMQFAEGNGEAARMLWDRHGHRIHRYATYVLGNAADADDVVQETMLRLWRKAPSWKPREIGIPAWTRKVCTNLCLDQLRRRKHQVPVPDDLPAAIVPADVSTEERERVTELYAAIARLPARQRVAIVLHHIDGQSNRQVSDVLGVSVSAVESMIARGMKTLREHLAARRDELGWRE